ncbi:MAG: hypothetical protein WCD70_01490 [Alphaproteobacteria bacterium]
MNTAYELSLLASYLRNAAKAWKNNPAWILAVAITADSYARKFGLKYEFPTAEATTPASGKTVSASGRKKASPAAKASLTKLTPDHIAKLENYLTKVTARFKAPTPDEDAAFLDRFMEHMKFEPLDRKIGQLLLLSAYGRLQPLFIAFGATGKQPDMEEIVATCLGEDKTAVQSRLAADAPMRNSGAVFHKTENSDGEPITQCLNYILDHKILTSIDNHEFDITATFEKLAGKPETPETEWGNYPQIKGEGEYAAKIIKGALQANTKGVNILIHGDNRVELNECAKSLSAHLGLPLYPVHEELSGADRPSSASARQVAGASALARLDNKLHIENVLAQSQTKALTLFDNMEDVFPSEKKNKMLSFRLSKAGTK